MKLEEIDRGFQELGLADDSARRSLRRLADLAPRAPEPSYETATVAHTAPQTTGVPDAKLEPGS